MCSAGPRGGWPLSSSRKRQSGQALIYGLFVLIGGLAALFFLFNTGQLAREKTKLVSTSDAVAYSAGVMHARALNFDAYLNRAMVANTVAIAQLVSVSSWVQYTNNLGTFGIVAGNSAKYPEYFPSYEVAAASGDELENNLNGDNGTLGSLETASDDVIKSMKEAQAATYNGLVPARSAVMDEVAQANYRGDGTVSVDPFPLTGNEFRDFIKSYGGDERTRFADVAKTSADKDAFLPSRVWRLPALYPNCVQALVFGRTDWLERRGGTELVSFDEWKAMDTMSEHVWVPASKWDLFCSAPSEIPAAWGLESAADSPSIDFNPTHYAYSILLNTISTGVAIATSSSWGYSGLPTFYDLSAAGLADPQLIFAIRVRRDKDQTLTSEGRSGIRNTARLNAYQAAPAGGSEMVSVSASQAFFQRDGVSKDNVYGSGLGKPQEIGSLFNPFWQTRLIQSDADVRKAQLMQGVVMP